MRFLAPIIRSYMGAHATLGFSPSTTRSTIARSYFSSCSASFRLYDVDSTSGASSAVHATLTEEELLNDHRFQFRKGLVELQNIFPHIVPQQWEIMNEACSLYFEWNEKVNLISRKDIQHLVPKHFFPSLSLSSLRNFEEGDTVIDIGSGGGFPGIPLAIACPNAKFTLLDSNKKKMHVAQQIIKSLKLKNVQTVIERAEYFSGSYDYIVGRAVASIPQFLQESSHLLNTKTTDGTASSQSEQKASRDGMGRGIMYLKGGDFESELKMVNIHDFKLYELQDLAGDDKKVLFIPAEQVGIYQQELKHRREVAKRAKERKRANRIQD